MVTSILRRLQSLPRERLEQVGKFGGHSLNLKLFTFLMCGGGSGYLKRSSVVYSLISTFHFIPYIYPRRYQ